MIELLLAGFLGYLLGSFPMGVVVCRLLGKGDPRREGSGHTGGLNVSRLAGIWAGVLTAIVDALLGATAVAGVMRLTDNPWAIPVAGVAAVVGHDWSIFIGFGGGIGLSILTGAFLYLSPALTLKMLVILALVWVILVKLLRVHRACSTIFTMLAVGPLLWMWGLSLPHVLLGVLGGAVIIIKTLPDWHRQYQ